MAGIKFDDKKAIMPISNNTGSGNIVADAFEGVAKGVVGPVANAIMENKRINANLEINKLNTVGAIVDNTLGVVETGLRTYSQIKYEKEETNRIKTQADAYIKNAKETTIQNRDTCRKEIEMAREKTRQVEKECDKEVKQAQINADKEVNIARINAQVQMKKNDQEHEHRMALLNQGNI